MHTVKSVSGLFPEFSGPWCPTFSLWRLDFTGSEHWAPFNCLWSRAFCIMGKPTGPLKVFSKNLGVHVWYMFTLPDFVFNTETFCSLYTIKLQGSRPPLQWQQLQWDILHPLDMSKKVQVFFVTAHSAFQGRRTQTHLAKLQDQ